MPFFAAMALSRFWTWMLLLSIAYIMVMLFSGRQYGLGALVNGRQGEPMLVNELDTTALVGTPLLAELRSAGTSGVQRSDTLYTLNGAGVVKVSVGTVPADGLFPTCRNTLTDLWLPLIGYLTFFCGCLLYTSPSPRD